MATLIKLYLADKIDEVASLNNDLCRILSSHIDKYKKEPMPGTTHFQQAALGTIDHYLEMRKKPHLLINEELFELKKRILKECPLGSGACVGSSIDLDRNVLSRYLGFDFPSSNSLYSTSNRDEVLDFCYVISKLSLHRQYFISELIVWSNQNFSWMRLPKEFCTGSSMMPNKLNPDSLELLRCDLKKILAWPNTLLFQLSSLRSGSSRDLQIIKGDCFQYSDKICEILTIFSALMERLEFATGNIRVSLNYGFIDATLEMENMVQNGVPLREAHHHIAQNVQGTNKGSFCNGEFDGVLASYKTIGSPMK